MKCELSANAAALAAVQALAFGEPWGEATIADLLASPGVSALAAPTADHPCAFVLIRVAADEAEILTLATVPEWRRRGAAKSLLRAAIDAAAGDGARAMFLEVAEDNLAAIRLYAAVGFHEIGQRAAYYQRPLGRADALVMRLDLNSRAARPYAGKDARPE